MILAEWSATDTNTILITIFGGITAILASIATLMQLMLKFRQDKSDVKVEQVASNLSVQNKKVEQVSETLISQDIVKNKKLDRLEAKADLNQTVTNDVHTLVNNRMGIALRTNAELAMRLAQVTKLPADYDAAEKYKAQADEHDEKQSNVDRK